MRSAQIVPDELRFAITRQCNGRCRHCYNMSGKDTDRLNTRDIVRILKDVHKRNPLLDRITLTGGEPLNEKDRILKIAHCARELNIRVRLVTRGWELDEKLCCEFKKSGVTRIQIGLDSSGKMNYTDKEQVQWDTCHSWLRDDKQGFQKTVEAIKIAINTGLNVSIRYSACKSNLDDICNTYHMVAALGVSKFKFRLLFPDGRAKKSLLEELITGENLAKAQYNLILATANNKTEVEITQPCIYKLPNRMEKDKNSNSYNSFKQACSCGTVAAYIDSNGDVKYCLFDESVLGNIFNDQFINIWNSTTADKARELRCPLDRSGYSCSSFKLLYTQFNNYSNFMRAYHDEAKKLKMDNKN